MALAPGERIGPYEICAQIGSGGMGEVYRARDTRLERTVAIKVLPLGGTDPSVPERFLREARAASALSHPNIVTIYDVGETGYGRYLVMEYVEGRPLRQVMLDLPAETGARIVGQVAAALAEAHRAGIVHRDVKPENIMVRADGQVRVLDFGIAKYTAPSVATDETTTVAAAILTREGTAMGTLQYMSPEQARGAPVTGASDVFSLGIVFYELSTGKRPFHADAWFDTLHAIATHEPVPPSRINADLPAAIEGLILRMLAKDPDQRPVAAEVAAALVQTGQASVVPEPATPRRPGRRNFVGRDAEFGRLTAEMARTITGRGAILLVSGEPGMGKTTLVERALEEVPLASRFRIARGRCSERLGSAEAFLPLLEALGNLTSAAGGQSLGALLKEFAPTWYRQVATADQSPEPSAPERAHLEVVRFFTEAARETPLLIFLEDLHWADTATVDLLAYLGPALAPLRLLIVGTFRPSELRLARHPFLRIKLDLQARGVCREISLDFLSPVEVARYIDLEFRVHNLPPGFAAMIHARTDGNPLFMADILRYLKDRGTVDQVDGVWQLAAPLDAVGRDLPESVRSMIERKIGQLEDADRRLLTIAAVQGAYFDSATVAAAGRLDPMQVEERLEELDRVLALVRFQDEKEFPDGTLTVRYNFHHALYQNAVYDQLRGTQKASLSRAVAEAWLARYPHGSGDIDSQLAILFEAARAPLRAAGHFLGAAGHALGKAAPHESLELAERGLALLEKAPAGAARDALEAQLLITRGVPVVIQRGFADPALEPLYLRARELAERAGDRRTGLGAVTGLFSYYGTLAQCERSLENGRIVERLAAELEDVDERVNAQRLLGFILAHMGRLSEARAAFERSFEIFDPERHRWHTTRYGLEPISSGHAFLGWIKTLQGEDGGGLASSQLALTRGLEIEALQSTGLAYSFAAFVHQLQDDYENCLQLGEAAIAFAESRDMALFRAYGRVWSGWAMAKLGRAGGVRRIRDGIANLDQIQSLISRPHFLGLLAEAQIAEGDRPAARASLDDALDWWCRTGNAYYDAELWRLCGTLAPDHVAAEAFARGIAVAATQGAVYFTARIEATARERRASARA